MGCTGGGGTTDEVFLQAQEAAQAAHRDSQGRLILIIFHLSPAPVTIGTRNWFNFASTSYILQRSFLRFKVQISN